MKLKHLHATPGKMIDFIGNKQVIDVTIQTHRPRDTYLKQMKHYFN